MFIRCTDVKKAISISMRRKQSRWNCIVEATTRTVVGVSLLICVSIASSSAQQQAPAVVPVGTVKAEHKPIAKTKNFVGRVEAQSRSSRASHRLLGRRAVQGGRACQGRPASLSYREGSVPGRRRPGGGGARGRQGKKAADRG